MEDLELARRAAEDAARESYGKLLAYLASRTRDLETAADALADAFLAALESWPERGVPERPEAWLLTAARNRVIDEARRNQTRVAGAEALKRIAAQPALLEMEAFPDERLKLLFICAHPAIDEAIRTPLMLQTVLGLDAARIASAFLVSPQAMSQRLVRAKTKIAAAGIPFAEPGAKDLPERLGAVLEAIYAAYGAGWEDAFGGSSQGLAAEALSLARMVVKLLPNEAEARGLLALLLHCQARTAARRDASGSFVPLSLQDVRLWSRERIQEAEAELTVAAGLCKAPGYFQLEAAIQSAHNGRAATGVTPWSAIRTLYDGLAALRPTVGVAVGRAAAIAEAESPARGLELLGELPAVAVNSYQPYWVLRAHLFRRLGRAVEAQEALSRAVGLTEDPAIRAYLLAQDPVLSGD